MTNDVYPRCTYPLRKCDMNLSGEFVETAGNNPLYSTGQMRYPILSSSHEHSCRRVAHCFGRQVSPPSSKSMCYRLIPTTPAIDPEQPAFINRTARKNSSAPPSLFSLSLATVVAVMGPLGVPCVPLHTVRRPDCWHFDLRLTCSPPCWRPGIYCLSSLRAARCDFDAASREP